MKTLTAIDLIEAKLKELNQGLADHFSADVIMLRTPLSVGTDDDVRNYIEDIKEHSPGKNKLCVLFETQGGYIEVVERIYSVFRKHYTEIIFIVPNYAFSAGTILVLSGDEIYMDSYSVLGPIDAQFEGEDGSWYSGTGYLSKFETYRKKVNEAKTPDEVRAELHYLIKKFDPARLFHIEQAQDHSRELLEKWLTKHKFKNWTVSETRGVAITEGYKKTRAQTIAEALANPEKWHSHGRGIGISELMNEEIGLKIENFEDDRDLNETIRGYYDLFVDFCGKQGVQNGVHGVCGLRRLR